MNDALAQTIDDGYFEVSASRRVWRGGDYNGSWGHERCVWRFPSQKAADDFVASGALKSDSICEPLDTPHVQFVQWHGVETNPAASEPGAAGKALAIIEHLQRQGKSRREIDTELANIGLEREADALGYGLHSDAVPAPLPQLPKNVISAVIAYGDDRADDKSTATSLSACITAIRSWGGSLCTDTSGGLQA